LPSQRSSKGNNGPPKIDNNDNSQQNATTPLQYVLKDIVAGRKYSITLFVGRPGINEAVAKL
jgi:hypothetical protein